MFSSLAFQSTFPENKLLIFLLRIVLAYQDAPLGMMVFES